MSVKLILDNYLGKNTRTSEKDMGDGTKQVCDLDTGECYVIKMKDGLIERVDNTMKTNRTLKVKVTPWGEIYVNGKMSGVTPPLHQLTLIPGSHTIEIRHPNFSTKTIQINPEDPLNEVVEHNFQ